MTLKEFIGDKVEYDPPSQTIFCETEKLGLQILINVRGWATISKQFESEKEAADFQDKMGEFFADAINANLEQL